MGPYDTRIIVRPSVMPIRLAAVRAVRVSAVAPVCAAGLRLSIEEHVRLNEVASCLGTDERELARHDRRGHDKR